MSTRSTFGTLPPSGGGLANDASGLGGPSTNHDATPRAHAPPSSPRPADQPVRDVDPRKQGTSHPTLFNAHLNEPVQPSHWQRDLYDHFANLFELPALPLTERSTDDAVARALQIIQPPTRTRIRGLALAVCTHWMRMQFRCKDADVGGPEIVALVSRMADRLGRMSARMQREFLDDLGYICVERLKLMWLWYLDVASRKVPGTPRRNLFMRVMTVVAIISYLFRGGQLRHDAVLGALGHIAAMSPWPDAVAVVCAFLDRLGPRFALEQTGWYFIQRLLAELSSFIVGRVPVDPLCQLVSAIRMLVAEWHHRTRVTLYDSCPIGNQRDNQLHGHHSQV